MKRFALLAVAALTVVPFTASAENKFIPTPMSDIVIGSASCMSGAACGGVGESRPVSYFLRNGMTVARLNEINELIEIDENTVFPPFTLVRTS